MGFIPNHGPDNAWRTEKGSMLAPNIEPPLVGHNSGDPRFNGEITGPQGWEAALVMSGEFDPDKTTGAGGTLAK